MNEYECLKNIYSRMIMLTAISPIAVLFFGPLLLIYILIPNIFLYSKYYRRNGGTVFEEHIGEMLRKCVIAMLIVFASFLPLISMLFITNIENGTGYMILMLSMVSIFLGLLIGWVYYLHGLIKASGTVDKSLLNNPV